MPIASRGHGIGRRSIHGSKLQPGTVTADRMSAGARAQLMAGRNDGLTGIGQGNTRYFMLTGFNSISTNRGDREILWNLPAQLRDLFIEVNQNNLDADSTIRVLINGTDPALTITVPAGGTGTFTPDSATDTFNVGEGDLVVLEVQAGSGSIGDTITMEAWTTEYVSLDP